jgi:hypothetical protein
VVVKKKILQLKPIHRLIGGAGMRLDSVLVTTAPVWDQDAQDAGQVESKDDNLADVLWVRIAAMRMYGMWACDGICIIYIYIYPYMNLMFFLMNNFKIWIVCR